MAAASYLTNELGDAFVEAGFAHLARAFFLRALEV